MPLTHIFLALLFLQTHKPGSISGTVTNAVTGGPVRKAHVTLHSNQNTYTATTDAEGHFAVAEVNPGAYTAFVEGAGFRAVPHPEPIRVAEEQQVTNLTFQLTPNGVMTGRVLDENGDPMAQISVQAQVETFGRTGRTMSTTAAAVTDDRGMYRFFDLPAGRYFLLAFVPVQAGVVNGRLHTDEVDTAYASSWFPGVVERSQATANQLSAGAELSGLDIRLHKVRVYHIRGKAVAQGSQHRLESPVMLTPCDSAEQGMYAPILRDGSFEAVDMPAGVWCAVILETRFDAHGWFARQPVTVTDHDVNNVVLTATPLGELRGQVLIDGEPPTKMQQVQVQFEPLENPGRFVGATAQSDGAFRLPEVQPGPYRVILNLPGAYLKSVRLNGQDTPDPRISVPATGGQLALLMATDAGEISGTLKGPGQYVTALAASSPGAISIAAFSAGNGSFVIRNVPPGDYQVLAWETRDTGLVEYPEFRKQFESRAVAVTVHSKGHESAALTAITEAEIEAARSRLR